MKRRRSRRSLRGLGSTRRACKHGRSKTTGKCLKHKRSRSGSLGRASSRRRSRR